MLWRPSGVHETRKVVVHAEGEDLGEAEVLAVSVASVRAVMAVASRVLEVLEI